MPSTADIRDPDLRAGLVAAEAALDAGDYTTAVRQVLEVYTRAVEGRPELIVPFVDLRGQFPKPGEGLPRRQGPHGPPWPDLGVGLSKTDAGRPVFEFRKQRFGMSEATTYFEYVLEVVARAEAHA